MPTAYCCHITPSESAVKLFPTLFTAGSNLAGLTGPS
jgi:hypothetical protein